MMYSATQRRALLVAAVGVLVPCALLPSKWMRWMNALGNRASMVVAPVKGPVWAVVNWVSPAEAPKPEAIRALENERDRWKWMYNHLLEDHENWVRKIEQQYGKDTLYNDVGVKKLLRPVIGPSTDTGSQLEVRAGAKDGLDTTAVATTVGVQLVGKVVRVGPRTSTVRLLTDPTSGTIDGRIVASDETPGPMCKGLFPVAGRKLQTRVRVETHQAEPAEGQTVRLLDDRWPRNAQMLVIGVIADKPTVDSTGWYVVTVKPTVDLERLSEVLLRIAAPETDDKAPSPSTDGSGP
jgi:hypothetical protein